MKLGIPVYEGVNLLDVTGPYEMFSWVNAQQKKGVVLNPLIISLDGGPVTSKAGVRFEAQASFAATPTLDVLWVPGGDIPALSKIMSDPKSPYLAYLNQVAPGAKWVCSVCEGALLAAKAGLLDDHDATTHWAFVECLKSFPKINVDTNNQRYVVSGNRLTGGGISSGLDESLKLIELLFGTFTAEFVQVQTQYFPKPPVEGTIPPAPACPVTW